MQEVKLLGEGLVRTDYPEEGTLEDKGPAGRGLGTLTPKSPRRRPVSGR